MSFSAAHWPGGAMLPSFPSSLAEGMIKVMKTLHGLSLLSPRSSLHRSMGALSLQRPNLKPIRPWQLLSAGSCTISILTLRDLVIYTSTCLLEFQGNHLIIFKIPGTEDKASSPYLPSSATHTPLFPGCSEIWVPNTIWGIHSPSTNIMNCSGEQFPGL